MSVTTLVIIGMIEIFLIALAYINSIIKIAESQNKVAVANSVLGLITKYGDNEEFLQDVMEALNRIDETD